MKEIFIIEGQKKITGEVKISGSKNTVLPIIFASLLTNEDIILKNVPDISDVKNSINLIRNIGSKIDINNSIYYINNSNINKNNIDKEIFKKTRASIWVIPSILTRFDNINVYYPGGCNIGERPIDLHIMCIKKFGFEVIEEYDNLTIKNKNKKNINNINISFNKYSVGATITSILLSVTFKNCFVSIFNCAIEPEIFYLCEFLNKLGANIKGHGTRKIEIKGVKKLFGGEFYINSDRIETGTFLIAAASTGGNIICYNSNYKELIFVINVLRKFGLNIIYGNDYIKLKSSIEKKLKSNSIYTSTYPGFPTDLQPHIVLLNSVSNGKSIITERIFNNRFTYINELNKLGTNIKKINNNKILCKGVKKLKFNSIKSNDLRSSAMLTIAGCIASGNTILEDIPYLDRGYEKFDIKLNSLGANIKRKKII